MRLFKQKTRAVLVAPPEFPWDPDHKLRQKTCNGCGTKGLGGWLVPDTIYGLNVTLACDIHDWEYAFGTDREQADIRFLANMMRIIEAEGGWLFKVLRRNRALSYYMAVRDLGGGAHNGATE